MRRHIFLCLCLLVTCLSLASCLPGKEKERKVIADALHVSQDVQAAKAGADMVAAAQQLLGDINLPVLNTGDLRTARCNDGQVVAYVARDAGITRNGALPASLAQNLKDRLGTQFTSQNVLSPAWIAQHCPGTSVNTVALNSPVLRIELTLANLTVTPNSNVTDMRMRACPNDSQGRPVPGVILTKTLAGGGAPVVESHCGAAVDEANKPNFTLSRGEIPDWRRQLNPATTADQTATLNFSCIAGTSGCSPIDPSAPGFSLVCTPQVDEALVVNPTFNSNTYNFEPDAADRNCGKCDPGNGPCWTGELVARVKKRSCQVKRGAVLGEKPDIVYDVAYVGAQCHKAAVIEDTCPVGSMFPNEKMLTQKGFAMREFIALQPAKNTSSAPGTNANQSIMAYYSKRGGNINTNANNDLIDLVNAPGTTVVTASNPQTPANFFLSRRNLNTIGAIRDFDSSFIDEMASQTALDPSRPKIYPPQPVQCFSLGQNCAAAALPEMVTVVVDRSASMEEEHMDTPIVPQQTSCRATMANLFKTDSATLHQACQAARDWQVAANESATAPHLRDRAVTNWNYGAEPITQGATNYDLAMEYLQQAYPASTSTTISPYDYLDDLLINKMMPALIDQAWLPRLKNGLILGQDCYPARVQDDSFGSCAPAYADIPALNRSDFIAKIANGGLRSCQSSCPGACITDATSRTTTGTSAGTPFVPSASMQYPDQSYIPVAVNNPDRMLVADTFLQSNLVAAMPPNSKMYYSEFFGAKIECEDGDDCSDTEPGFTDETYKWHGIDDIQASNVADRPVIVDTTLAGVAPSQANQAYISLMVSKAIGTKWNRQHGPGKIKSAGSTPLFLSIDRALDQTIERLFKQPGKSNNSPAALVILTDGDDTGRNSEHFFRNVCTPELVPLKYECGKRHWVSGGFLGLGGHYEWDYYTVPDAAVKTQYGYIDHQTRRAYCHAQGWTDSYNKIVAPGETRMEQVDSLVGLVGRNFPNTKIYMLDMGSTKLANSCVDVRNGIYPSADVPLAQQRQVLSYFKYNASAANKIAEDFGKAMGGGTASKEIGRQMCQMKIRDEWGNNNNIRISDDPISVNQALNYSATSHAIPECDIRSLNVGGSSAPAPVFTPNPIIPPTGHPPYSPTGTGNEDCINGYMRDTMMACIQ